jgi:hypothetical protein
VGGTCGTNGDKRNVYSLLVGEPEGKRQLGRPRRRWMDNIKMDILEMGPLVTTAWRILGLRMEGTASSWRLAVNILNKQPRTNNKGRSSSLGVGRGANNPSP